MKLREKRNRIDSTMPFNPMDRAQYKERLGLAFIAGYVTYSHVYCVQVVCNAAEAESR